MTGQNDANKRLFRISHANILGYFGFIAFSFASAFSLSLAACLHCAKWLAMAMLTTDIVRTSKSTKRYTAEK